jgi:hypothetical protein
MKARAEVRFNYGSPREAKAVARLLEVDNRVAPRSLGIKTRAEGGSVVTRMGHEKLGTFLAALDDLFFTEKLIRGVLSLADDENARHSFDKK